MAASDLILFHYTCTHGAEQINASGFLLPRPQPILGGREVTWATDLQPPVPEALGLQPSLRLPCVRTGHRFVVLEPGAFAPWVVWAREQRLTWEQRAALEGAPGALPRHWWVATRPTATRPVLLDQRRSSRVPT